MNLLLLPGSSKASKEWLQQVEANLAPQFDRTYRHDYAHWENNGSGIDLDLEVGRLAASTHDLSTYMIFAKSAGTILTSKATAEGVLHPKACLFVGLPLIMVRDHNLPANEWLQTTDFPIDILQHTADPFGSYADVVQYVAATNQSNIVAHEVPGNTHDYLEFQLIKDFAEKLAR